MARYKSSNEDYSAPDQPRERIDYRMQAPPRRRPTPVRSEYYDDYEEEPAPRPQPRRAWEHDDTPYEPLSEDENPIHEFQRPPRKGTGVLRSEIQKFLRHHKAVKSFRLGTFGEGESGVTIVELK